jgi:hypothetical protein
MVSRAVIKMPVDENLKRCTAPVGTEASKEVGRGEPTALFFIVKIISAPAVDCSAYTIFYPLKITDRYFRYNHLVMYVFSDYHLKNPPRTSIKLLGNGKINPGQ